MKHLFYILPMALILCVTCKKKTPDPAPTPTPAPAADVTPPVLTLTGTIKDTLFLQTSYTDPGATAMDNVDGDRTPFIVKTGSVNTNVAGSYTLGYSVKDNALNQSTASRSVHVRNALWLVGGNYLATCTCTKSNPGTAPDSVYSSSSSPIVTISNTTNNSFTVSTLNIGTGSAVSNVSIMREASNSLTFSYSQPNAQPFNPSGTISFGSPVSFTLNTHTYDVYYMNIQKNCKSVFTKQ